MLTFKKNIAHFCVFVYYIAGQAMVLSQLHQSCCPCKTRPSGGDRFLGIGYHCRMPIKIWLYYLDCRRLDAMAVFGFRPTRRSTAILTKTHRLFACKFTGRHDPSYSIQISRQLFMHARSQASMQLDRGLFLFCWRVYRIRMHRYIARGCLIQLTRPRVIILDLKSQPK